VKVAVVGATGLLGRALCTELAARGDAVSAVSRRGRAGIAGAADVRWDPAEGPAPPALADADAVVNLAGAPIERWRWTAARKREIRDSRVLTTRGIVDVLMAAPAPRLLLNASGVGYYGPRGDEPVDESTSAGADFLARTCIAWEGEARRAERAGHRVALLRTGIVLAARGGALPTMARPVRLLVGGPIGGGRQWVPWIHIDDEIGLMRHILDRPGVAGPVNATAPAPARQRDFVAALGRVLRRPAVLPVPAFALRVAMGEMATLALDGQRALPRAALASGYRFAHPELEPALRDLLG
jgi:uncharacterized protein